MNIVSINSYPVEDLIEKVLKVRLVGHDQPVAYSSAKIVCVPVKEMVPCQRYLHAPTLATVSEVVKSLQNKFWMSPSRMYGWVELVTDSGEKIPFLPPVIEWSLPDNKHIICDGMHRVSVLHMLSEWINVVVATPADYPYYAYPLPGGWSDVEIVSTVPEHKKRYREPEDHKALFRDFNAVFPGVQKKRVVGV